MHICTIDSICVDRNLIKSIISRQHEAIIFVAFKYVNTGSQITSAKQKMGRRIQVYINADNRKRLLRAVSGHLQCQKTIIVMY